MYSGFYTRTHVLLNLLNELRKIENKLVVYRFYYTANEFYLFNNTGAQMLDSILSSYLKTTMKLRLR